MSKKKKMEENGRSQEVIRKSNHHGSSIFSVKICAAKCHMSHVWSKVFTTVSLALPFFQRPETPTTLPPTVSPQISTISYVEIPSQLPTIPSNLGSHTCWLGHLWYHRPSYIPTLRVKTGWKKIHLPTPAPENCAGETDIYSFCIHFSEPFAVSFREGSFI